MPWWVDNSKFDLLSKTYLVSVEYEICCLLTFFILSCDWNLMHSNEGSESHKLDTTDNSVHLNCGILCAKCSPVAAKDLSFRSDAGPAEAYCKQLSSQSTLFSSDLHLWILRVVHSISVWYRSSVILKFYSNWFSILCMNCIQCCGSNINIVNGINLNYIFHLQPYMLDICMAVRLSTVSQNLSNGNE